MSRRPRFLFGNRKSKSEEGTGGPSSISGDRKAEKHPYKGIQRIPENCEDEFLYYYRQHRSEDAYPEDWFTHRRNDIRPELKHSFTFPGVGVSSVTSHPLATASIANSGSSGGMNLHHHHDLSRESSEYDYRSCYSSFPRPAAPSSVASVASSSRLDMLRDHHRRPAGHHGQQDVGSVIADEEQQQLLHDDLSGMLRTKMNLLNRRTTTAAATAAASTPRDDSQSRDSGHSSSGGTASNNSPVFKGVRQRPITNSNVFPRPSPPSSSTRRPSRVVGRGLNRFSAWYDTDANHHHQEQQQHSCEQSSVYSYNSARDRGDEDSGVSSVATTICTNDNNHAAFAGGPSKFEQHEANQQPHSHCEPTYWTPNIMSMSAASMSHHPTVEEDCLAKSSTSLNNKRQQQQQQDFSRLQESTCKNPKVSMLETMTLNSGGDCRRSWINVCATYFLVVLGIFFLLILLAIHHEVTCQRNSTSKVLDEVSLAKKLNESLFGQDLAIEILNRVLLMTSDGLSGGQQQQQPKAALLLFGWTGTGKSFVTRLIEEAFVLKANIHRFSVPLHLSSAANHYVLDNLIGEMENSCGGPNLIILEDVDDGNDIAQKKLTEFIQSMATMVVTKNQKSSNIEMKKKVLLVATMSTGGLAMNKMMLDLTSSSSSLTSNILTSAFSRKNGDDDPAGVNGPAPPREDIRVEQITQMLSDANIKLPMESHLRENGFQTTLVPFLPLTREHVTKCVIKEMLAQGGGVPSRQDIRLILEEMEFFSESFPIFSTSGCKRIAGKVSFLLASKESFLGIA